MRRPEYPVLGAERSREPRETAGGVPVPPPPPETPGDPTVGRDGASQRLRRWWVDLAEYEAGQVADKAVEYGATDLIDIGRELARINGWDMDDAQCAEAGIYFYLRGKVSRWTAALTEGRMVSDDTLHDIGVYVRMAQRVREYGGWPGV